MKPTQKQIDADMKQAARLIAIIRTTAGMEGWNAALDVAAELARDEDGRFTWTDDHKNTKMLERCANDIAAAILNLKHKEQSDEPS